MSCETTYRFPRRLQLSERAEPGRFVVFCGTDGSGKSTLIETTTEYLRGKNRDFCEVKYPSQFIHTFRPYNEYRRNLNRDKYCYRAIAMAAMADRINVVDKVVRPALTASKIVISHRYVYAGLVRLHMHGDVRERWFHEACRYLIAPDIAFLVTASPAQIAQRLRARTYESNPEQQIEEACLFQELLLQLAEENDFITIETTNQTVQESSEFVRQKLSSVLCADAGASI